MKLRKARKQAYSRGGMIAFATFFLAVAASPMCEEAHALRLPPMLNYIGAGIAVVTRTTPARSSNDGVLAIISSPRLFLSRTPPEDNL